MIKNIVFISTILFCCLSVFNCEDDFVPFVPNDSEPEIVDKTIVDSFKWTSIIDLDLLQSKRLSLVRYPLIYEDLVIFSVFEQGGFVAFNRFTGEQVWDNRGQFNNNSIFNPKVHDGIVYYVNGSGVRAFDAATGSVVHNTTDFVENQFLNADFGIYKDKIYVHVDDFNFEEPIFNEWRSNKIEDINTTDWSRFNRVEPLMNDNKKRQYTEPAFYVDNNGDETMIYTAFESHDYFVTGTTAMISYNLSADSIKWVKKDFILRGALNRAPIIDSDRVYLLGAAYATCVSADTGELIWEIGAPIMKDEQTSYADYFVHEDKLLIFGQKEQILCLNKINGSVIWTRQSDTPSGDVNVIENIGTERNSVNVYNNRAYYINNGGLITSVSLSNGAIGSAYRLPTWIDIEEHDVRLFEQTFRPHMTISEDGVIYVDDGFRFLAFDVPE